jgi:hypothetical protein
MNNFFYRLLCCGLIVVFSPYTASAEFYKYKDKNGHLIFTDDVSRVPVNQRDEVTIFNSIQPKDLPPDETGDRPLQENLSTNNVSVQKEELERESFQLQQARKALEEEKEKVTTIAEQQAYNEKVTLLNQQIERFSQKLDSFKKTGSGDNGDLGSE